MPKLKRRMACCRNQFDPFCLANATSGGPEMEMSFPPGFSTLRDFLALLQVGAFNQYLPSCQTHQRDGRCLFHGEILGLQRYVSLIHGDEFRERPDPVLMWPRIDRVARLEPSHVGPDTDYDPGHVVA